MSYQQVHDMGYPQEETTTSSTKLPGDLCDCPLCLSVVHERTLAPIGEGGDRIETRCPPLLISLLTSHGGIF